MNTITIATKTANASVTVITTVANVTVSTAKATKSFGSTFLTAFKAEWAKQHAA